MGLGVVVGGGGELCQFTWEYKSAIPHLLRDLVKSLCESRDGRPGLSVLTSLMVSVDVKLY